MGILVGVRHHPSLHEYPGCMPDRRKVRTSCEKTPYLDRGDDTLKMTQIKGAKSKMPG
jgi:hypothetical protein